MAVVDEARGEVFAQNDDGLTCLHCAVLQSNIRLIKYIVSRWPATLDVQAAGGVYCVYVCMCVCLTIQYTACKIHCFSLAGYIRRAGSRRCVCVYVCMYVCMYVCLIIQYTAYKIQ